MVRPFGAVAHFVKGFAGAMLAIASDAVLTSLVSK
jgi:hypothetical protein